MVGLVIAIMRGYANHETIEMTRSAYKVDVPTAPALGLMLDKVTFYLESNYFSKLRLNLNSFQKLHYNKYNRKYGHDGFHQSLEFTELQDEIEKFQHEYIFSNIIKKEISKKS